MNIKEAIEIIECFFRESDNKCANRECDLANPMCQYEREAAFEIALSALREKAERENPKPLTLEELKERVGKPVYRRWRNGNGTWEVLERIEEKTETGNPVILVFFQHDDWFPERFDCVELFDHEPKEAR